MNEAEKHILSHSAEFLKGYLKAMQELQEILHESIQELTDRLAWAVDEYDRGCAKLQELIDEKEGK